MLRILWAASAACVLAHGHRLHAAADSSDHSAELGEALLGGIRKLGEIWPRQGGRLHKSAFSQANFDGELQALKAGVQEALKEGLAAKLLAQVAAAAQMEKAHEAEASAVAEALAQSPLRPTNPQAATSQQAERWLAQALNQPRAKGALSLLTPAAASTSTTPKPESKWKKFSTIFTPSALQIMLMPKGEGFHAVFRIMPQVLKSGASYWSAPKQARFMQFYRVGWNYPNNMQLYFVLGTTKGSRNVRVGIKVPKERPKARVAPATAFEHKVGGFTEFQFGNTPPTFRSFISLRVHWDWIFTLDDSRKFQLSATVIGGLGFGPAEVRCYIHLTLPKEWGGAGKDNKIDYGGISIEVLNNGQMTQTPMSLLDEAAAWFTPAAEKKLFNEDGSELKDGQGSVLAKLTNGVHPEHVQAYEDYQFLMEMLLSDPNALYGLNKKLTEAGKKAEPTGFDENRLFLVYDDQKPNEEVVKKAFEDRDRARALKQQKAVQEILRAEDIGEPGIANKALAKSGKVYHHAFNPNPGAYIGKRRFSVGDVQKSPEHVQEFDKDRLKEEMGDLFKDKKTGVANAPVVLPDQEFNKDEQKDQPPRAEKLKVDQQIKKDDENEGSNVDQQAADEKNLMDLIDADEKSPEPVQGSNVDQQALPAIGEADKKQRLEAAKRWKELEELEQENELDKLL